MSDNITEIDNFDTSVPEPQIGDRTYPFVVPQALRSLANRSRWLVNTLSGATGSTANLDSTNTVPFDTQTFVVPAPTRSPLLYTLAFALINKIRYTQQFVYGAGVFGTLQVPITAHVESDGAGNYQHPGNTVITGSPMWSTWVDGSAEPYWYQFATPTNAPQLFWNVPWIPPTGRIAVFTVSIQGNTGHAGLPGVMPSLTLYKRDVSGISVVANVVDTSANTSQYQTRHDLLISGLTDSLNVGGAHYFFKFTGEAGANKLSQLRLYSCSITLSQP